MATDNGVSLKIKTDFKDVNVSAEETIKKLDKMKQMLQKIGSDNGLDNTNSKLKNTIQLLANLETGDITTKINSTLSSLSQASNQLNNVAKSTEKIKYYMSDTSTGISSISSNITNLVLSESELNDKLEETKSKMQSIAAAEGLDSLNSNLKQTVTYMKDENTGKLSANISTTVEKLKENNNELEENNNELEERNKNLSNNNQLNNTFNSLLSKTTSTLKKVNNALKLSNAVGLIYTFKKISNATASFLDSSSDYVENLNLMQVAFSETRDEAESFVNGLADIFGLDESQMTRQLGYYRQIGNALNIDNKYADLLAKNLLKMQLDMSSLYNLSFERSGEVLQASMAGKQLLPLLIVILIANFFNCWKPKHRCAW